VLRLPHHRKAPKRCATFDKTLKTDETYRLYLRDLVYLIKERHAELKSEQSDDDFKAGEEFGYYAVLEMIQNQTTGFMIEPEDFGFNDFEKYKIKKNNEK